MSNRTKDLAHYVIYRRDPSELGKTKLAKVLWAADVMMYRAHGKSISGADCFVKQQFGPIPVGFHEAVSTLIIEGKVVERKSHTPVGPRSEYLWLEEPDISAFTGEEVALLERAADYICRNHTASSISQATHDALWDEIPIGGRIPLNAAATLPCEPSAETIAWAEID